MPRAPTREEKVLGVFMGACAVAYATCTLAFPAAGELVARLANWVYPFLAPTPERAEGIWICLTASLMGGIAAASFMVWRDPAGWRDLALVVAVSKLVASACALSFLVLAPPERRYAGYLVVITTDFPLFVATFFLWRRAAASTASD